MCLRRSASPSSTLTGRCGRSARCTSSSPLPLTGWGSSPLEHPEWKTTQPFQAVLEGDMAALGKAGLAGIEQIMGATHAGMTSEEFNEIAHNWFDGAEHPQFHRPYTSLAYQPMVEVLTHFRANGFRTYIVSGGGIEFVRAICDRMYGVLPDQVVGSSIKTKYELRDGTPVLVRLAEVDYFDDKEGKPVAIQKFIGQRPIAAFGNSDGDQQMLQWTAAGAARNLTGPRRSHRCRSRVRLSSFAHGDAEARARGGESARLDGRQHEGRLEGDLRPRVNPPGTAAYGTSTVRITGSATIVAVSGPPLSVAYQSCGIVIVQVPVASSDPSMVMNRFSSPSGPWSAGFCVR